MTLDSSHRQEVPNYRAELCTTTRVVVVECHTVRADCMCVRVGEITDAFRTWRSLSRSLPPPTISLFLLSFSCSRSQHVFAMVEGWDASTNMLSPASAAVDEYLSERSS